MTTPMMGSQRLPRTPWKSASRTIPTVPLPESNGALLAEDGTENIVQFAINPNKMTLSHTATSGQKKAVSKQVVRNNKEKTVLTAEAALQDLGTTTLDLGDLTFDGPDVAKTCKQFLDWTNPSTATAGTTNPKLPRLTFKWGPLSYSVFLTLAKVTYERFTSRGKPIRAKVTLNFIVNPPLPTPTNPTSGGIQGRRSHMLVAGENLQHLAMANYGHPGAWRAVAAANGIEDPLAVRPGTVIYMPAATELADGRPG